MGTEDRIYSKIYGVTATGRYPINEFDYYALAGIGLASNENENKYKYKNKYKDNAISLRGEIGVNMQIFKHFGLGVSTGIITNEMDIYHKGNNTKKLWGTYVNINFVGFFE